MNTLTANNVKNEPYTDIFVNVSYNKNVVYGIKNGKMQQITINKEYTAIFHDGYNLNDFKKIVMTFKTFKDFLQVYNKFKTFKNSQYMTRLFNKNHIQLRYFKD